MSVAISENPPDAFDTVKYLGQNSTMSDKLTIQRQGRGRHSLTVTRRPDRYDVTTTGGENLTADEVDQIAAFIGDDPDGAVTLEKLRGRVG